MKIKYKLIFGAKALYLMGLTLTLGCGGGGSGGSNPAAEFCTGKNANADYCKQTQNVADTQTKSAAITASDMAARAAQNIADAKALVGKNPVGTRTGGQAISAATAGDTKGVEMGKAPSRKDILSNDPHGKKESGAGAGGNSGGPMAGGEIHMGATAVAGQVDGVSVASRGNIYENVAAYTGGGGGGPNVAAGGGSKSAGYSGGEAGTGADTLKYGSGDGTAKDALNLPSMVGEDPEDYFTRIGLDENIFRKISNRYTQKAAVLSNVKP